MRSCWRVLRERRCCRVGRGGADSERRVGLSGRAVADGGAGERAARGRVPAGWADSGGRLAVVRRAAVTCARPENPGVPVLLTSVMSFPALAKKPTGRSVRHVRSSPCLKTDHSVGIGNIVIFDHVVNKKMRRRFPGWSFPAMGWLASPPPRADTRIRADGMTACRAAAPSAAGLIPGRARARLRTGRRPLPDSAPPGMVAEPLRSATPAGIIGPSRMSGGPTGR